MQIYIMSFRSSPAATVACRKAVKMIVIDDLRKKGNELYGKRKFDGWFSRISMNL